MVYWVISTLTDLIKSSSNADTSELFDDLLVGASHPYMYS